MRHVLDHVAKATVLSHSSSEEHLLLAYMGHGALRDLREHRKSGLLHRQRYILQRNALPAERHCRRYHSGECDIHALDRIRKLVVLRPIPGQLFENRTSVEPHSEVPSELIQHIADPYVLRLPENPVTALGERYDLCVPAGCIEERGIPASCEGATDLNVRYAMIHTYNRYAPCACERPCRGRGDPETRPQTRTHRE